MVKYNRRNKEFKEFESLLEEIMQHEKNYSDDELSEELCEAEISDASSDILIDEEVSEDEESVEEEISYVPGQLYNFNTVCNSKVDQSEDFPAENDEDEIKITSDLIKSLAINREEYKNTKNIINPKETKKKMSKRCPNID